MSTYFPKGEIARKWYVVDADGQTLGRLSSRVARILSGKDNPRYTPFLDTGDHVVVINASKVKLTGLKAKPRSIAIIPVSPAVCGKKNLPSVWPAIPSSLCRTPLKACCPSQSWDVHGHEAQGLS